MFAAEVNFGNSESGAFSDNDGATDVDVLSGLLMANYAYSDTASVTGRISYEEVDNSTDDEDVVKYTLAHNKALADNLGLITEVSYADTNEAGDNVSELGLAVELLFTF